MISKNLAESKLLVAFLQWDESTGLAVVHARQPVSKGQLLALTQERWLPIRGSFVNLKASKGTSENCHLIRFSVDRLKSDDSVESVDPQNQFCRYKCDSVWLDAVAKLSKLESEIEVLRSVLLRLDLRASEQPITPESKTEIHEVSSNTDYDNGQEASTCHDNGQETSTSVPTSSDIFGSPDPIMSPSGFRTVHPVTRDRLAMDRRHPLRFPLLLTFLDRRTR